MASAQVTEEINGQVTEMREDIDVSLRTSSLLTFRKQGEWVARGLMAFMLGSSSTTELKVENVNLSVLLSNNNSNNNNFENFSSA